LSLKAWPELTRACRLTHETTLLRAWLCLRATAPGLCGILPLTDALDALTSSFGWSPQYANRILQKGGWWRISISNNGTKFLRLMSLERVSERLDTRSGRPITITWDELTSGHQSFSAACYAGWIAQGRNGERTISRQTLSKLWTASKPTQRQWEKNRIHKRRNLARLPKPTLETLSRYPDCDHPKVRQRNGELWIQLPNTYQAKKRRAAWGQRERSAWLKRDTGNQRLYFPTTSSARKSEALWAYAIINHKEGLWLAV